MLKKSLKKLPLLFWLVVLAIVINTIQFPYIREAAGQRWGALYRVDSPDIFNENNMIQNTIVLHNAYISLGEHAPGSTLIVNKKHPFAPGKGTRFKILSVGKVKDIKIVDTNLESLLGNFNREQNLTASGELFTGVPHRNSGDPGILWKLYIGDGSTKNIVFMSTHDNSEWLFVDVSLLPSNVQRELQI